MLSSYYNNQKLRYIKFNVLSESVSLSIGTLYTALPRLLITTGLTAMTNLQCTMYEASQGQQKLHSKFHDASPLQIYTSYMVECST